MKTATHPAHLDVDPACSGKDPELWFPRRTVPAEVVATCTSCPVREACLRYAHLYDVRGIWAATTYAQRNAYRAAYGIQAVPVQIGDLPNVRREPARTKAPREAPREAPRSAGDTKRCPRCRTDRLKTDFYSNAGNADGLAVWCKPCFRERAGEAS
ncbi:WhiB family transcriptional regulator [Nonomuraea sp. B12E4]|uniref:WhiB family transcriptional regulator n=1 Tax=Nonomuraea sp. B12E4 TaxID=3153564 RepID=UPI00325DCCBE